MTQFLSLGKERKCTPKKKLHNSGRPFSINKGEGKQKRELGVVKAAMTIQRSNTEGEKGKGHSRRK